MLSKMTDQEIREALKALDRRDDVELSSWECDFIETVLHGPQAWIYGPNTTFRLSSKQRKKALEIIERYEVDDHDGGQETITKIPEDMKKYFR